MSKLHTEHFGQFVQVKENVSITLGETTKNVSAVFYINSINDLLKWQTNLVESGTHATLKGDSSTMTRSASFAGTDTFEEYLQLLQFGDPKVMKRIREAKEKAVKNLESVTSKSIQYDVEGLFFDIGKVMSGEPECWIKPQEEEAPKEVIIRISTAASNGVDAKDIEDGAGQLLGMVHKLEADGLRVKVENWLHTTEAQKRGNATNLLTVMTVKDFDEKINYAKMSVMVSPAFQRRGMFMLREALLDKNLASGYGRSEIFSNEVTQTYYPTAMQDLHHKLFTEGE